MNKKLCFVDENLRIVTSFENAKAFVNLLKGNIVEILFIQPIAHNCNKVQSIASVRKLDYKGIKVLPNVNTCKLINKYLESIGKKPAIVSAHLAFIEEKGIYYSNWNGKMDENGILQPTNLDEKLENVYGAIQINLETFNKINPTRCFPEDFITSKTYN